MKSSPKTRYTLIGKLRNSQDAEAWEEFTKIYQPLIMGICRSKGLQHADSIDITQEVLTKVAVAIESFDHSAKSANFRGWLYRLTRNLVIDFFRHRQKRLLVQADTAMLLAAEELSSSQESFEFRTAYQKRIFAIVAEDVRSQVQPSTWQAFWQSEIKRRSVAEVATELNMTTGAVYIARSRVLARFKTKVAQKLEETGEQFV